MLKLQAAGSPGNDAIELDAIDEVFPDTPALLSLKAHIGHTLGASGAAEIALLIGNLEAGIWPAALHAHDSSLRHALSARAPQQGARILASIIGFGGSHACVVLQDTAVAPGLPAARFTPAPRLWEVCGRSEEVLPEAWRTTLVTLLGERPRRIGIWAEAGLYGALQCMRDAGEESLPAGAILRISSLGGPILAILQTLQTIAEDGIAMPVAFLQSQPGQLPAIIAQALKWQGDARIANGRNPLELLRTACVEAGPEGVLIGWLDQEQEAAGAVSIVASSQWLRLRPVDADNIAGNVEFAPATAAMMQTCRYVRIGKTGLEFGLAPSPAIT